MWQCAHCCVVCDFGVLVLCPTFILMLFAHVCVFCLFEVTCAGDLISWLRVRSAGCAGCLLRACLLCAFFVVCVCRVVSFCPS